MYKHFTAYRQYELFQWKKSIVFYLDEISSLQVKLAELIKERSDIISRNKAKSYRTLLYRMTEFLSACKSNIIKQQETLKDPTDINSSKMSEDEAESNQSILRDNIKSAEIKYVSIKYDTYKFLSAFVKHTENKILNTGVV